MGLGAPFGRTPMAQPPAPPSSKELWGGRNTAIELELIIQTNKNEKAFLLTPPNYHSHLQRLETLSDTKIKKGLAYFFKK